LILRSNLLTTLILRKLSMKVKPRTVREHMRKFATKVASTQLRVLATCWFPGARCGSPDGRGDSLLNPDVAAERRILGGPRACVRSHQGVVNSAFGVGLAEWVPMVYVARVNYAVSSIRQRELPAPT
jgi:hypothetical protein